MLFEKLSPSHNCHDRNALYFNFPHIMETPASHSGSIVGDPRLLILSCSETHVSHFFFKQNVCPMFSPTFWQFYTRSPLAFVQHWKHEVTGRGYKYKFKLQCNGRHSHRTIVFFFYFCIFLFSFQFCTFILFSISVS